MPNISRRLIYVFDSAVPNLQALIDAVGPDQRIVILDSTSDGVLQLAKALEFETDIDAIHVFSHGSPGSLALGSRTLSLASIPEYSAALAQIGQSLSAEGDLLLYGCNVAQGEVGLAFVEQLAIATGADVAASDDLTGAAGLGGDAQLEIRTGDVTAPPIFEQRVLDNINAVFGIKPIALTQFPLGGTIIVTQGYGGDTSHGNNPWSIDFSAAENTPILAVRSGTVVAIRTGSSNGDTVAGGYGNFVTIEHTGGFFATYAHLKTDNVNLGQVVSAGTQIGTVGLTGQSYGAHLHLHFGTLTNGTKTEGTGDIARASGPISIDSAPPAFFFGFFPRKRSWKPRQR